MSPRSLRDRASNLEVGEGLRRVDTRIKFTPAPPPKKTWRERVYDAVARSFNRR